MECREIRKDAYSDGWLDAHGGGWTPSQSLNQAVSLQTEQWLLCQEFATGSRVIGMQ